MSGVKPVLIKNTKYVGALSRKADKIPVIQKYILPVNEENDSWFLDNKDNAGITVINIPANNLDTSWTGNQVKPFLFLKSIDVIL